MFFLVYLSPSSAVLRDKNRTLKPIVVDYFFPFRWLVGHIEFRECGTHHSVEGTKIYIKKTMSTHECEEKQGVK